MTDPVRAHYEALPYPPRDPRDEANRLVTGSPSRLAELDHYVFGGARDFRRPFRALVAGGGTGDAAIMLAQQLADIGADAEVVFLDWSKATQQVAEARATVRKLTNLRFVTGSLLDVDGSGGAPGCCPAPSRCSGSRAASPAAAPQSTASPARSKWMPRPCGRRSDGSLSCRPPSGSRAWPGGIMRTPQR